MLILASSSPRRRELLAQIGVPHTVMPANIEEARFPDEKPESYVKRLACEKAEAVAALARTGTVLAADTTVVLLGAVLNKPKDLVEAERMLRSLAGRTHYVHTGVAIVRNSARHIHVETTAVRFTSIPEEELAAYLATGDCLDKAGAYGIQGYAARWVERIEGDYSNVVGLPLAAVVRLLRQVETL